MLFRLNPGSGLPIYLQLMEQIKHGIATGALRAGEQLPGIRKMAEMLAMNPNTVAKAYRELEHEGILKLHHGAGAFISEQVDGHLANRMKKAQPIVEQAVARLLELGVPGEEIRRLVEAVLLERERAKNAPQ
ncbi:MAG: GntR family transcriptional regulator [Bryobacteraceae bacterium]|nr:GntR family transcriptional regulator [Bryobacteraceae bacterium]